MDSVDVSLGARYFNLKNNLELIPKLTPLGDWKCWHFEYCGDFKKYRAQRKRSNYKCVLFYYVAGMQHSWSLPSNALYKYNKNNYNHYLNL